MNMPQLTMNPGPYFTDPLPISAVTVAADTIPRTTITSTFACSSSSHGSVRHHQAEMAEYSFTLEQKFDALTPRDQMIMFDVLEISSIGTREEIRNRFVRFELIRKYGPGAVEWNEEVDRLKIPCTMVAYNITPRSDGSFRMVHRNQSLRLGQTSEPYQASIQSSQFQSYSSQFPSDEKMHYFDLLAHYQQLSTRVANSSSLNSSVPSQALPSPLSPFSSTLSQPSQPAVPFSIPSTPVPTPDPVTEPSSPPPPHFMYSVNAPQSPHAPEFNTAEYALAENSSRDPPQFPLCRTSTFLIKPPVTTQLPTLTPDPPRTPYPQSETQGRDSYGTKQLPAFMSVREIMAKDETFADHSGREMKIGYSSEQDDGSFVRITYENVYRFVDRIELGSVEISPPREFQNTPVSKPQIRPFRDKIPEKVALEVPPPLVWKYPFSSTKFSPPPYIPLPSFLSFGVLSTVY